MLLIDVSKKLFKWCWINFKSLLQNLMDEVVKSVYAKLSDLFVGQTEICWRNFPRSNAAMETRNCSGAQTF